MAEGMRVFLVLLDEAES
ncbi:hypothetical protein [Nocardia sp. GAS34]